MGVIRWEDVHRAVYTVVESKAINAFHGFLHWMIRSYSQIAEQQEWPLVVELLSTKHKTK